MNIFSIMLSCHSKQYALVCQSCLTLWDPMDCSPPGSPVHGDSPGRILEWVAIPFSNSKQFISTILVI